MIDEVEADDALVVILRKHAGESPNEFVIYKLVMNNVEFRSPSLFTRSLRIGSLAARFIAMVSLGRGKPISPAKLRGPGITCSATPTLER